MVVFIKGYKGKAKSTGKDFQVVTLAELHETKEGVLFGKVKDFFVRPEVNCNCEFGDVVQVEWSEGGFNGAVEPKALFVVEESPFKKLYVKN
ncbi:MAG: hypothetical protein IJ514_03055 [Clostridia bacterium]|nr:hypothetical protein [Clostridia bacterium]